MFSVLPSSRAMSSSSSKYGFFFFSLVNYTFDVNLRVKFMYVPGNLLK